ncbi:hypothetical protein OS493_040398 [Desmophyllum pertusum]|uniref:Uncharacterized protein n=1 Tax=Desmophyllum pertusum TaxID=174260 RepID=A0A9W9YWB8_9CNID|nr:hypothetical protein OS493_040398 [Desmophyllum pertusum]
MLWPLKDLLLKLNCCKIRSKSWKSNFPLLNKQRQRKEAKQKKEEISSFAFRNEEQKTSPTGKERREVQEEVVENGLASEVEQALSSFQLSWDSTKKEDAIEPAIESKTKGGMDLDSIPATRHSAMNIFWRRKDLLRLKQKKHKPTRASWAKSLGDDEYDDMFGIMRHRAMRERRDSRPSKRMPQNKRGSQFSPDIQGRRACLFLCFSNWGVSSCYTDPYSGKTFVFNDESGCPKTVTHPLHMRYGPLAFP